MKIKSDIYQFSNCIKLYLGHGWVTAFQLSSLGDGEVIVTETLGQESLGSFVVSAESLFIGFTPNCSGKFPVAVFKFKKIFYILSFEVQFYW